MVLYHPMRDDHTPDLSMEFWSYWNPLISTPLETQQRYEYSWGIPCRVWRE
jgi:hypothetical protein